MEKSRYLNDFYTKLSKGVYDEHLKLPFASRELLVASVERRVQRKLDKGVTPMLSDNEIDICISEVIAAAGSTFYLMVKNGILEPNEDGGYQLSIKGARALREVSRQN